MTRSTFFYLQADGKEIDRNSRFDGKFYVFYDLNVILNIVNMDVLKNDDKVKDLMSLIKTIELSWAQYDTALLESYSKGFTIPIDACKDKIVGAAFQINEIISANGVQTWVTDSSEMAEYTELFLSINHFNFILLSLVKATSIMIKNDKSSKSPIENMMEFMDWYDRTLGFKLAIIVRVVLRLFYESGFDKGIRSLVKKQGKDIEKSLRSSSCDIWHIYHFLYRTRSVEEFSPERAIFVTDDEEMAKILKSVDLMRIIGIDNHGRIAINDVFNGINLPIGDIEIISEWASKEYKGERPFSRLKVSKLVREELESLKSLYENTRLPWQTH